MTTARFAEHEDVPEIIGLLGEMHRESRFAEYPLDTEKLSVMVHRVIEHIDGACIVAADSDSFAGVLIGGVAEFFFSRARHAEAQIIYVLPGRRGGWAAIRMENVFRQWAGNTDAVEVSAGDSASVPGTSMDAFYTRIGYQALGRNYVKRLNHVRA